MDGGCQQCEDRDNGKESERVGGVRRKYGPTGVMETWRGRGRKKSRKLKKRELRNCVFSLRGVNRSRARGCLSCSVSTAAAGQERGIERED